MTTQKRTTQPEEGAALRKWREGIGVKQSVLAERAGLSQNLVSLLEAGKRNFTKDSSDKIYRAQKELNTERAEQLTDIALNRDSRQVAREERNKSNLSLVKENLRLKQELEAERRARQQDNQRALEPFVSSITELQIERNIKPLTEELAEVRRELADMHRLLALKADAAGKEAQAQDLQEQIEQRERVKKGK